jgi:hypothetical protein
VRRQGQRPRLLAPGSLLHTSPLLLLELVETVES